MLEDADIVLVKDGTVATITASLTHTLTFNTDAGIYKLAIDLSGDADFTTGSDWTVYGHPDTEQLDSVDVAFIICTFTIETASEQAIRLLTEFMFPASTLGASGSHSTTVIDMTGVVDANTKADGLKNEILAVHDATNDTVELVRCTGSTVTTLLATVEAIDDSGVMSFTPAAGDHVWRAGQYTANVDQVSDTPVTWSTTRGLAGTALPNANADGVGGLPVSDAGSLDLDAKIGAMTYTKANELDVNTQSINGAAVVGDGNATPWDGA